MPAVNAGSMADIAFLLLIFFLVTTTIETDAGIDRKLPSENTDPITIEYKRKNLFPVLVDGEGRLLVKNELLDLKELRSMAISFIDNGGADPNNPNYCDYCMGLRDQTSSDSPSKAIITINTQRETEYGVYIAVQNELVGAYTELRNREANRLYHRNYTDMEEQYQNAQTILLVKAELKKNIQHLRDLYPLNIVEPQQ